MSNITNEDINNFIEWSEENRELFELLCWCKKNDINTLASCGGHEFEEAEEHGVEPYIVLALDDNSIKYVGEIISELSDVQEIMIEEGLNSKNFIVRSNPSNCSEVFYKIKLAIIKHLMREHGERFGEKSQSGYRYIKGQQILNGAKKIQRSQTNKVPYYKMDTREKDFYEFRSGSISWGRWFGTGITIPKKFMKTYKKYSKLQKKYEPTTFECWEDIRTYVINTEYDNPPVDLYVRPELEEKIEQQVWDFVKQNLLDELQSKGTPFEVRYHERKRDSSYYTNDEKNENGIGKFIIKIPKGQEHSNSENPYDGRDLFEFVYSIFHEYKHIMQRKEYKYEVRDSKENRVFSKAEVIARYLPKCGDNNYANDPREIDAQIYGIEQAIKYIEDKFPWIDEEQCCIEYVREFATNQKENGFEKLSFDDKKNNSVDEILKDLNNRKNNPVREELSKESLDYDFYFESYFDFDESDQEYLLRKLILEEYIEKYNACQDANKKDDMLIEAILRVYPDSLDEYPLLEHQTQKNKEANIIEDNSRKALNSGIADWLKNCRNAIGVGLEKVKQTTEKYLKKSDKQIDDKQNKDER